MMRGHSKRVSKSDGDWALRMAVATLWSGVGKAQVDPARAGLRELFHG